MKQKKEIPRQSAKVKRGTEFIVIATNEHVWFEILRPDGRYLMCFSEARAITDSYDDFDKEELKPVNGSRSSIKQVVRPVSAEEKAHRESLNDFFDRMALTMPYNCMNCGKALYANTKFFKRCVTSHILPKAIFKSIACNTNNVLFLGTSLLGICNCHNNWDDKGSEDRAKMKVYDLALERFELLKPFLNDKELIQAYSYLNIAFQ